jgi:hypothetical protein
MGGSGGGSGGAGSASGPALPSDIAVYLEACAKAANAAVEAALSGGTLTDDIGQALCSVGVASTSVSTGGPASAAPAAPHTGTWSVSLFQPCCLAEFVAGTVCALATSGKTITKCGKKLPPGQQALTGAERTAAEAARRVEVAHAVSAVLAPVYVCCHGAVAHTHTLPPPPHLLDIQGTGRLVHVVRCRFCVATTGSAVPLEIVTATSSDGSSIQLCLPAPDSKEAALIASMLGASQADLRCARVKARPDFATVTVGCAGRIILPRLRARGTCMLACGCVHALSPSASRNPPPPVSGSVCLLTAGRRGWLSRGS